MAGEPEEMSVVEHLTELRRRIIYVLIVLGAGLLLGLSVAKPVYLYLVGTDQAQSFMLHAFSFWDGIGIYMKIALGVALVPGIPFAAYQLWAFISPALRLQERNAALRYIPYVLILFILGILFGYYIVFPLALSFTMSIARDMGLQETYGIAQYFNFLFGLVIPLALLFELPLLLMFLTKLRILNPLRLRKLRRYAYFVLAFIAVVITPPDFISDFLVMIPLILLYEFSIFLSAVVYRKQLAADAAIEARYIRREN